jgi:REP element-mobilizing transposase RayT
MKSSRREVIGSQRTLLISNQLRADIAPLTLEGREVIRKYLVECSEKHGIDVLTWCIMPTSYRVILHTPTGLASRKDEQNTPIVRFTKAFQIRIMGWINYCSKQHGSIWKCRYQASALVTPGECVAAAVSVDAFPVFAGIVDTADEYFFTSYYHACAGDTAAQQGISKLMGTPDTPWRKIKRRYAKLLKLPA